MGPPPAILALGAGGRLPEPLPACCHKADCFLVRDRPPRQPGSTAVRPDAGRLTLSRDRAGELAVGRTENPFRNSAWTSA